MAGASRATSVGIVGLIHAASGESGCVRVSWHLLRGVLSSERPGDSL